MAITKVAPKTEATTEQTTEEPAAEKSATIEDVKNIVSDAIKELKDLVTGAPKEGEEPSASTEQDPSPDPSSMSSKATEQHWERKIAEKAMDLLSKDDREKEQKAEQKQQATPEQAPGKPPFLRRFVGLAD